MSASGVDAHEFRVLDRTERFATRMFRILTDRVAMPNGRTADRDYMVHIGAVGVVAVDDDGRVVLVRQYRHPLGRVIWELPAGLIDVRGEPLEVAAARELAEETDLQAGRLELLLDVHTSPGCSNEVIRLFLARDLQPVPDGRRHERHDEEAGIEVHRVDLDEAVAMALRGEISNASCLVGLLATARVRDQGWPPLRSVSTPLPQTVPVPQSSDEGGHVHT